MSAPAGLPQSTALALGALGLVMCGGLVLGVKIFRESRALKTELVALRSAPTSVAPAKDPAPTVESASVAAEIERETALLRAAEAKAVEIGKSLPAMSNEEWRSLGRIEELGQQAGDFVRSFADFLGRQKKNEEIKPEENNRFGQEMMSWLKRMEVIGEMEDTPAEIARLHTATLSTRLKLDAATAERVRQQIERDFFQLREQKLTRPQRPETERDDWHLRRRTALNEATQRIEALIPAAQREQHAVGQSLHLGTGLRTATEVRPDGHGSMTMIFDLPGIDWKF